MISLTKSSAQSPTSPLTMQLKLSFTSAREPFQLKQMSRKLSASSQWLPRTDFSWPCPTYAQPMPDCRNDSLPSNPQRERRPALPLQEWSAPDMRVLHLQRSAKPCRPPVSTILSTQVIASGSAQLRQLHDVALPTPQQNHQADGRAQPISCTHAPPQDTRRLIGYPQQVILLFLFNTLTLTSSVSPPQPEILAFFLDSYHGSLLYALHMLFFQSNIRICIHSTNPIMTATRSRI